MPKLIKRPSVPSAAALAAGDQAALLQGLLVLVARWMGIAGSHIGACSRLQPADLVAAGPQGRSPEARALLAAARELCDLLAQAPLGRQALLDLGLEPIAWQMMGREGPAILSVPNPIGRP